VLFECISSYLNGSFSDDSLPSRSVSFVCIDSAMVRVYDAVVDGCIVIQKIESEGELNEADIAVFTERGTLLHSSASLYSLLYQSTELYS
jgi:hypothetical protein